MEGIDWVGGLEGGRVIGGISASRRVFYPETLQRNVWGFQIKELLVSYLVKDDCMVLSRC